MNASIRSAVTTFFVALLLLPFGSTSRAQEAIPALERAQLGFSSTINDQEIIDLLESSGAYGRAAFAWSTGLSGSHRTEDHLSASAFLAQAREKTISFMESALAANSMRLNRFQESNGREVVSASEQLQQELRSLLNIRSQINGALSAARTGAPLFFALEVHGTRSELDKLRSSNAVQVFIDAQTKDRKSVAARVQAIKPAAYRHEYRDPVLMTVSPTDLYDHLLEPTEVEVDVGVKGVK